MTLFRNVNFSLTNFKVIILRIVREMSPAISKSVYQPNIRAVAAERATLLRQWPELTRSQACENRVDLCVSESANIRH
jgi:hypothetical protein